MTTHGNRKRYLSISCLFLASVLGAFGINPETAYKHLLDANWEKAIIAYETMLTTEKDNPQFHFNLGIAYFHTYRFSSAQREFESALLLNIEEPKFQARAEYNLGVTLFEQAKLYASIDEVRSLDYLREAILAFESTIELQPESESAAKNLHICQQLLHTLEGKKNRNEEEDSEDADQVSPQGPSSNQQEETQDSESGKDSNPGEKTPSGAGDPSTASPSDNPETTDKVAGAPGSQRLDIQEALLLLDSIENDEKRITLSELVEPSEKAPSESEANW